MQYDVRVIEGVRKLDGDLTAVDGVSFTVGKKEIFGILGPNGAGKAVTLEMIETLRTIDAGRIAVDGIDVAASPSDVRSMIVGLRSGRCCVPPLRRRRSAGNGATCVRGTRITHDAPHCTA